MDGELLSLKWNNHRTTFLHIIGSLRNKAAYTDATLACEGKFYPVHRLVLSTCSEYFGAIFERTPCKSPVVVLKDIECKNLEFLLDYMYVGEVNVRQNELAALIRAAECLRIKGLAVPDEDPTLSTPNNSSKERLKSDSQRDSSPPAKRQRRHQSSSEEKRHNLRKDCHSLEERLEKNSSLETNSVSDVQSTVIKLEPREVDSGSEGNMSEHVDVNVGLRGIDDMRTDDGRGTDDNEVENESNDIQEFFKSSIDKEEPVSLTDYATDFAGPSGVQNNTGTISHWDSDNSFQSDSLSVATAVSSASQPESQQQVRREERTWERLFTTGEGRYSGETNSTNVLHGVAESRVHYSFSSRNSGTSYATHSCPFCPYTSAHKCNMTKHIRKHTGEKPFQCTSCEYRSNDQSHIKRHIMTKHWRPNTVDL